MCMYMYSYNRTKIVQSSFFFIVFEMKIIKFEINILLLVLIQAIIEFILAMDSIRDQYALEPPRLNDQNHQAD